jgi:hypothetical protein
MAKMIADRPDGEPRAFGLRHDEEPARSPHTTTHHFPEKEKLQ